MRTFSPKAIFFDFGDTLATINPSYNGFYKRHIDRCGGQYCEDIFAQGVAWVGREILARRPYHCEIKSKEFWLEAYEKVLKTCGVDTLTASREAHVMWDEHQAHDCYVLFPDAQHALEFLHERDIIVGVLSNFDQSILGKINHLGISHYFDHIFYSTGIGKAKPDEAAFLHVCEEVGLKPEEVLYIGDDHAHDHIPCKKIGMSGILIDRHDRYSEEMPKIKSLQEIKFLLTCL